MTPEVIAKLQECKSQAIDAINRTSFFITQSKVERVLGLLVDAALPECGLGQLCELHTPGQNSIPLAEVVGFDQNFAKLAALDNLEGVSTLTRVVPVAVAHEITMGPYLLGKVLDGYGRDFDSRQFLVPPVNTKQERVKVLENSVSALERPPIHEILETGIKSLDGLLTFARGQRVGIFAPAGCGKTTLLASLARQIDSEVIILGLIGERGRELNEFLERELTPELRQRCVVICATSDRSSMERARAAHTASAIAQYFSRQGHHVTLMIDSLTRFCRALREIGFASGEPPARGGFPPSVFAELPRLIERSGTDSNGTVTGIYTILMEDAKGGSDVIAEEARSLLDGHIVLSRKLSEVGHFPAIFVQESLSRVMDKIVEKSQIIHAREVRSFLHALDEVDLLLKLNEYKEGSDFLVDKALAVKSELMGFLRQDNHELVSMSDTLLYLSKLAG